jgi:hypothetical protein
MHACRYQPQQQQQQRWCTIARAEQAVALWGKPAVSNLGFPAYYALLAAYRLAGEHAKVRQGSRGFQEQGFEVFEGGFKSFLQGFGRFGCCCCQLTGWLRSGWAAMGRTFTAALCGCGGVGWNCTAWMLDSTLTNRSVAAAGVNMLYIAVYCFDLVNSNDCCPAGC